MGSLESISHILVREEHHDDLMLHRREYTCFMLDLDRNQAVVLIAEARWGNPTTISRNPGGGTGPSINCPMPIDLSVKPSLKRTRALLNSRSLRHLHAIGFRALGATSDPR